MRNSTLTLKWTLILIAFIGFQSCNQKSKGSTTADPFQGMKKLSKHQEIRDRIEQENEMTKDPATGLVPKKLLMDARIQTRKNINQNIAKNPIPNVTWDERGPNNVGGRTRALMFDPNDSADKKAWAGGVGGGIWYTDDITAANANWQRVDDFWSNMAVVSIAHDPINTSIFYVGTGEGFSNADAIDGDGIWKTTDGGATWNQLSNTTAFNDCNKIVSWKANHVIVATNNGLRLSSDAGSSWTTVRSGSHSDIEAAANGDLYASNFGGDIYKSVDDGANWTTVRDGSGRRVELATAPSDANYVYAIVSEGFGGQVSNILKSTNAGSTWVDKAIPNYKSQNCSFDSNNTFTRGQSWYDLISIVSPTDRDKVIIGGIDLYRSEDGGNTWETISYWTGGCDAYVHADQHALASRPNFPDQVIAGNDGGVYYSANAFSTGSNPTWNAQNENYNVTQFYAVAIHPGFDVNNLLAGAQDNGTKRLTSAGIGGATNVTGGDGAFCHIDQLNSNIQITSYVYNNYYRSLNGSSFSGLSLGNTGRFINPTDYDSETKKLYACKGTNEYLVVENLDLSPTPPNTTMAMADFGGQVSCVRVCPNVTDRVYFGINAQRIARVDDAAGTPQFTDLGMPSSGYISSIDVEKGNADHLLVTYSNYNVTSVFESTDAGVTWIAVEGNLPNMPIRWGIFDPNNADQAILATELGVWTTDNLNAGSTQWSATNSGLANVRVDMIEYRESDNLVAAATHGRGVFTSTSFSLGCNVGNLTTGTQTCNVGNNTFDQEVFLTLNNTPSSGTVSLNGQVFSFPFDQLTTTQTYVLTNMANDGQPVDVNVVLSADAACGRLIEDAFIAPNSGCSLDNQVCADALTLTGTGTYTTNGPATGNGCSNCSNAQHADWYKFTAPSDGTVDINTCLKGVDTRLWVYTGSCTSLTAYAGNDDACALSSSNSNAWATEISAMPVTAGTTYFFEWDDRWSAAGFDFEFVFNGSGGCVGQSYICVNKQASGDNSGCDWINGFTNLQEAINHADANEEINTIWIKADFYTPGLSGEVPLRTTSFSCNSALTLLGGFLGNETSEEQRNSATYFTSLSGDIGLPSITADNSLHVIQHNSSNLLTLDGIIVYAGNANLGTDTSGAGILNSGNLSIINCEISSHLSAEDGSAISNDGTSAILSLENVDFDNNANAAMINKNGANITIAAASTNNVN